MHWTGSTPGQTATDNWPALRPWTLVRELKLSHSSRQVLTYNLKWNLLSLGWLFILFLPCLIYHYNFWHQIAQVLVTSRSPTSSVVFLDAISCSSKDQLQGEDLRVLGNPRCDRHIYISIFHTLSSSALGGEPEPVGLSAPPENEHQHGIRWDLWMTFGWLQSKPLARSRDVMPEPFRNLMLTIEILERDARENGRESQASLARAVDMKKTMGLKLIRWNLTVALMHFSRGRPIFTRSDVM